MPGTTARGPISAIPYVIPNNWIRYNFAALAQLLVDAKAAVQALTALPYQKSWVEALQQIQLKREIAGTSKIEGADFTDGELDAALRPDATPEQLLTRSQRQANAAMNTYRWIAALPPDRPIDAELIAEVHRRIVSGCDDDHCEPGRIRSRDYNVTFGVPPHRGCEGGDPCRDAFQQLARAVQQEFQGHDLLIRALALHYHFAAIHPFQDGNGRTARALEALVLQRAGLTDRAFIAMSNYYYDEKSQYLSTLSAARAAGHDLTPFLAFGLKGIRLQCERLTAEIRRHMKKALFRNLMYDLFNRLQSRRTRVIAERQIAILKLLLEVESMKFADLIRRTEPNYARVANKGKALVRDLSGLVALRALTAADSGLITINLDWPQEITESEFFETVKRMPKAKTHPFLQ
jgi:Fic family protein